MRDAAKAQSFAYRMLQQLMKPRAIRFVFEPDREKSTPLKLLAKQLGDLEKENPMPERALCAEVLIFAPIDEVKAMEDQIREWGEDHSWYPRKIYRIESSVPRGMPRTFHTGVLCRSTDDRYFDPESLIDLIHAHTEHLCYPDPIY